MVETSGRKPEEYALHSLRIESASVLAAGGDVGTSHTAGREMEVRCV